ncbi:MAG TPA: hypothetical protein V6D18_19540 [Thermosynechococcaceae cyanobacterium]
MLLTRVQPSRCKVQLCSSYPAECCGRCAHQANEHCWEDFSSMFGRKVDPIPYGTQAIGVCPEFEPLGG